MLDIDRAKVEVPYATRFWGQDCTCDPRYVEKALGDGNLLLGLQPLDARPSYYLIRIDSSWHFYGCRKCKDDCPDQVTEHMDEIYDAIEDEYGEADRIEESNQELEPGEEPDSTGWPVLSLNSGSCWFEADPAKYLRTSWTAIGYGNTKPGNWLKRHGWKLEFTRPHGFATTHYWRSPDGKLHNQTLALIEQRSRNRWSDIAGGATQLSRAVGTADRGERKVPVLLREHGMVNTELMMAPANPNPARRSRHGNGGNLGAPAAGGGERACGR